MSTYRRTFSQYKLLRQSFQISLNTFLGHVPPGKIWKIAIGLFCVCVCVYGTDIREQHIYHQEPSDVYEERMRPGHWLSLVLCVSFSALTQMVGW